MTTPTRIKQKSFVIVVLLVITTVVSTATILTVIGSPHSELAWKIAEPLLNLFLSLL